MSPEGDPDRFHDVKFKDPVVTAVVDEYDGQDIYVYTVSERESASSTDV